MNKIDNEDFYLLQYHTALGDFINSYMAHHSIKIPYEHKQSIINLSMSKLKVSLDETIKIVQLTKVDRND